MEITNDSKDSIFGRPATPLEKEANLRALTELHRLFPALPKYKVGDFLMNCTAFPCCSLLYAIHVQAFELSKRCSKSVQRAYRTVYRDMDKCCDYVSRKDKKLGIKHY